MNSIPGRASKVLILEIDLSSGKVEKRDLGTDMREKYLGGRGINSKILYDNVGPETDALSPDNVLIFGTGVLGGTGIPTSSGMSVSAKSPLCVFGYSQVGGSFPPELRKAGYDHIVIKGKAEKPVFIWIDNDKVEIRSAAHLWGKGVQETDRLVKEELGDPSIKVAATGQAGENLVRIANIIVTLNRGAGGRMGAVMGSKNLKAVAVRGSGDIKPTNEKLVRELSRNLVKRIKEYPIFQVRCQYGAGHSLEMMYQIGAAPIKNLSTAVFNEVANVDRHALSKYYTGSTAGCPACPISHHFSWEIKEGPYAGETGVGLEAGPIELFSSTVGNSYAPAVFKATNLVNDYGIDAYESANVIAAAMEWLEKGIITKDDLDGIELRWGDHLAVMEILHKISRREGVGDLLAEGCVRAAEKVGKGAKDCISHAKGRTSGFLDWRVLKAGCLSEVTSIPVCEMMDGWPAAPECIGGIAGLGGGELTPEYKAMILERFGSLDAVDPLSYNNKVPSVIYYQDFAIVMDSLHLCMFTSEWALEACTLKDAAQLFQAVTGFDIGKEDLLRAAVRIRDLERAFWVREGFTRKDDRLQGKIMNEAVPDGRFKGERLDQAKIDKMLDEYYQMRGWDIGTGIPTKEKLLEDGLEDVVEDLEKMGKL